MLIARQIFFAGRVQGVGFRFTTKHLATGFEVTGWVRNLADGRVELLVQGEEAEVVAFIREIRESVLAGHIQTTHEHPATVEKGLRGFTVLGNA